VSKSSGCDSLASRLFGVIDLRRGVAVHAIAGLRAQYQPVVADWIQPGDAIALASRYRKWGVNSLYIADLDAISVLEPQIDLLQKLVAISEVTLIDAGPASASVSESLASNTSVKFVVPTESCVSIEQWADAVKQVPHHQVVMGLDLIGSSVRTSRSIASGTTPFCSARLLSHVSPWIERAMTLGVSSVLALDLAFVGAGRGPGSGPACETIRQRWPSLSLISGGGVRHREDLDVLRNAGCDRILVGTSLHRDDTAKRLIGLH
jgi:phosphoribosylformimino-5-aminoimidazole carboxamide ribotide isomerase